MYSSHQREVFKLSAQTPFIFLYITYSEKSGEKATIKEKTCSLTRENLCSGQVAKIFS